MLFVFDRTAALAFWMRNTFIPLDIVFVGDDGKVTRWAAGEPLSAALIPSGSPCRFVLELNAGQAEAIDLKPGDRLIWLGGPAALSHS
jgi:uncharacterized membrane protein (UPF0127 family)